MRTGIITSETFGELFQEISAARENGALELKRAEGDLEILFHQGRIVDIKSAGVSGATLLSERFRLAQVQCVGGTTYQEIEESGGEIHGEPVTGALLREYIEHLILDEIFSIETSAGIAYAFTHRMISYDRERCPSISVGKVLLDIVGLEEEGEAFERNFSSETWVRPDPEIEPRGKDEERVHALMGEGRTVQSLYRHSLMNRCLFQETLGALLGRGALHCGSPEEFSLQEEPLGAQEEVLELSSAEISSTIASDTDDNLEDMPGEAFEALLDGEEFTGEQPSFLKRANARLMRANWLVQFLHHLYFAAFLFGLWQAVLLQRMSW